ncbi:hypothetical protein [Nocardioides sp. AE5]|uniref:hypothetical protein n=1 Tax=Nocardioides sp. AE5 TaxID=2962573 RepID=UPI0028822B10|nr:hypothetical protein [Nocardioides sp. AE5]MDT0201130.1 hypothetical protein [Nocardioides sp. AE5]
MPSSPVPVLRRTTLVGAPLLAALTACKWTEGSPSPTAEQPPEPDDDAQVDEAIAALRAADAVLVDVEAALPVLADALAPLAAMHAADLALLEAPPAVDASAPPSAGASEPPAPPQTARDGRKLVVLSEDELQKTLVRLAGSVGSGPLARVLASMAAGVAQHIAALPPPPEEQA